MKIRQKTKSAVAKRFSVSATGKLKRKHAYRSHMAIGSSTKQRRQLRKDGFVHKADAKRFEQCI